MPDEETPRVDPDADVDVTDAAKLGKPAKPLKPGKVDLKLVFASEIASIDKILVVVGERCKSLKTDGRGIIAMLRAAKDKMSKVK